MTQKEIEQLKAAIRPFILAAENYADCADERYVDNDAMITVGDLRELRAAVSRGEGSGIFSR